MKKIVLTFDDGYKSHFEIVRPLLKEHGISATFFITGELVASRDHPRYMNIEQLHQLKVENFELGGHSHQHLNLTLNSVDHRTQIESMNTFFQKNGLDKPLTFAYPGFHVDKTLIEYFKSTEIKFARAGCEKTKNFDDFQKGGLGSSFSFVNDNPYNVNCLGVFGENFQSKEFAESLELIGEDQVGVYCFHDIGVKTLNVHLSLDEFEKVLGIIIRNNLEICKFSEMK